MTRRHCILLLAALLVGTIASRAQSLSLEEIVAKSLEARGGKEAWAKVKTMRLQATTTMQQAGIESELVILMKRPNRYHASMEVMGSKMIQCFDGTKAWYTNPMTGAAEVMPESQAASLRDQADFEGPLADWATKGNSVTLAGTVDVDGIKAYKLIVKDKSGSTKSIFINAETFLEVKQEMESAAMGQSMMVEVYRSDYRNVGGIMFPFRVETKMMGMIVSTTEISDVQLNVPVDDATFVMPK